MRKKAYVIGAAGATTATGVAVQLQGQIQNAGPGMGHNGGPPLDDPIIERIKVLGKRYGSVLERLGKLLRSTSALWWVLDFLEGTPLNADEVIRQKFENYKFSDQKKLDRHFKDHGSDFGSKDAAEYQRQASRFISEAKDRQSTLIGIRKNGDIVFFDTATNEYAVLSNSGYIRTYYIPNPAIHRYPTNLDYFYASF